MRFKITFLTTALLMTALMFPSLAHLKANNTPQNKNEASPAAGVFRVVLNGFKVNHESDDDILEGDGKRDEVYLRADVWVLNMNDTVSYRRSPRSVLMGDINNQENPPRIAAGTASGDGGLRTNDTWPINEPWRRVRNPLPNRPPMLLWEGELVRGENMAVIMPSVWEWDSRDPSESEINWDPSAGAWFTMNEQACLNRIERGSTEFLFDYGQPFDLGSQRGTRPIGESHRGFSRDFIFLKPQALAFTFDAALQAARSTPSRVGYGVIAVNYVDREDHGDYTLYIQVEQVK